MLAWIRFILSAVFMIIGLIAFASSVLGVFRFGFIMNRMHAAGIGDTLGVFCVVCSLVIGTGLSLDSLKLILVVAFLWFTSPTSSHFLAQIEFFTNKDPDRHMRREDRHDAS